jgi:hypothetical protein
MQPIVSRVDANGDPTVPQDQYAPPKAEAAERLPGVRIGRAPLAAIWAGALLSVGWGIYRDLHLYGRIGQATATVLVGRLVFWGVVTGLLIARVRWARAMCRVLAVGNFLGSVWSVYAMHHSSSIGFYAVRVLGMIIYASLFFLLRPPAKVGGEAPQT